MATPGRRGHCPICRAHVAEPTDLDGMWTGSKRNGGPAGGGVHRTRCGVCGAVLVAFNDVYDDRGRIVPESERGADLGLAWARDGVPWQSILRLLLLAGLGIGSLLWAWRG